MANSTTTKAEFIENDKLIDQYIKTFDAVDDPIVYVLVRTSPYTCLLYTSDAADD